MRVEHLEYAPRSERAEREPTRHMPQDDVRATPATAWPESSAALHYNPRLSLPNRADEVVGYTSGVFDLFHVGHLRILQNAAGLCDRLIVGVSSDELLQYKGKAPIVPFSERMEIVREVKGVSAVVPAYDMDTLAMWERLKFEIMFVGDDWHGTEDWNAIEVRFSEVGVRIVHFPYAQGTSSNMIANDLTPARTSSD